MMRMLLAIAAVVWAVTADAADCPFSADGVDDGLRAAATCKEASRLLSDCALGASGDVARAAIVQERCERDFLPRLKADQRRTYRRGLAHCARTYARETGTMYRSMEAFCAAELAERYSGRALRTPGKR